MEEQVEKLTAKQREVLRLVSRGQTSKEIAQTLAAKGQPIGYRSVDARIEAAVRVLGARDRRQAAECLRAVEAGEASYPLLSYPPELPQPAIWPAPDATEAPAPRWRAAAEGLWRAKPNDLTAAQRLGLMMVRFGALATGAAILVLAMRSA